MADAAVLPDRALDQHVGIVGRTGSGKTYTGKGFVERLLRGRRHVVVVDPTSAWWGLRSSADGTAPGFPVIVFGGERADVPISDQAGRGLGEIIVERRVSCVLDVAEFTMAGRRRFQTDVLEALYTRTRHPLHLMLDEADEVAPQRPMPDQTMLLHRAEQIVRRGRSRGLRTIMITQRPAVLHKRDPGGRRLPCTARRRGWRDRRAASPDMSTEVAPTRSALPAPAARTARTGAELRILRVLAQRHPARLTVPQWATLAGMSRRGGTWGTYVSRLRVAGYLDERDGLVGAFASGLAIADVQPSQPQTAAEVRAM